MLDSLAIVFDCRRVHSRDVLFQRLTLDKSHGIAETAVRRFSKPVNWHDAWMIQPRGNLRLRAETANGNRGGRDVSAG